jgi:predicted transposase YbfD/YdcC
LKKGETGVVTQTHKVDEGNIIEAFKEEFPDANLDEKQLDHFFRHLFNRAFSAGAVDAVQDVKWYIDKQYIGRVPVAGNEV